MPTIDPYPWFLNKHVELTVNDRAVLTRITVAEWTDHWRPLLSKLHELHLKHPGRLLIAIAGPPGTGKSVLAEQISWIINRGLLPDCHALALPMDGFHYPSSYLAQHFRTLPDGTLLPLTDCKGGPDTFDVADLRRHLQLLRAAPEEAFWPGYSRITHDPVPRHFRVHQSINIIFVEGNYLLLDRGIYAGIPAFFDLRIYLDTPPVSIVAELVQRHLAGGKTEDAAKDWVKKNDLPNARIVESTRQAADLVIERNTDADIVALRWKGETPALSE